VAADDLTIQGFSPPRRGRGPALQMAFKKPEEVVGNHIAKHQAMKLAKMLMAYDFEARKNPFVEEGGFVFTFLGDGAPGTGKTTLIQMMAGLVHGYCEVAGYPFRYRNLSPDSIDSYQGKSGQNAKAFVAEITDPSVIGFGTVDDIDLLAGKRGDRQSSAGQMEVTAVLMEIFAGRQTVVRGNCTFGMFSNSPRTWTTRCASAPAPRFLVDGPQSRADYVGHPGASAGQEPTDPCGHHRRMRRNRSTRGGESYAAHSRPRRRPCAVWERLEREGALDTLAGSAPTSRRSRRWTALHGGAVKNITDAVKVRAHGRGAARRVDGRARLFLRKDYDPRRR
jgi:energy-coupling factor transporter ATP-binding protein EcfA2